MAIGVGAKITGSRPPRARELKLDFRGENVRVIVSRPPRARELKLPEPIGPAGKRIVAPPAGA